LGGYPTWNVLSLLFLFRLGLTLLLLLLFSPVAESPLMEGGGSAYTWVVLGGYGILVLLGGLAMYARWPGRDQQVELAVFVDIGAFTLLMHMSGGVSSGLGLLLALSVAAGALLLEGRLSLLFASLATLAVIAEQVYRQLFLGGTTADLTRAGLLGLLYFGLAALAQLLYGRIRQAEALAEERRGDIEDLSKINDFIIRKMETGVIVIDEAQRLHLMNAAAGSLLGRTDAVSGAPLAKIAPALARWLNEGGDDGRWDRRLVRIHDRDLQPTCEVLGRDFTRGAVIFLHDTQELAQQAQQIKLAALGKLTGSIAHNIRNPLAAISHASQLLGESAALAPDDLHLLDIVARNASRIEETVQSILQLSRRNQSEAQNVELAAWLSDFCSDWTEARSFPAENLTLDIGQAPIYVRADPRHLYQILGNLCANAETHGRGTVSVANIYIHAGRDAESGRVMAEVMDEGPGVDAQTAREIFDPFFTTSNAGTGLGLYLARELAETNGARLEYAPRPSGGSCFRVTFAA
jgi:two-component system sensor histidine kinase PilS (NtrC family)